MNKKLKYSIIISSTAIVLSVAVLLSVLILKHPDKSDGDTNTPAGAETPENESTDTKQSTDIVNLIDYDFSEGFTNTGISKNTVLIYKNPAKLSENPEISRRAGVGVLLSSELKIAMNGSEWVDADINDYVFEGQIYHKDWVYFNFSEKYLYYKGKLCKLYTDSPYFKTAFDNAEEYNGSYKVGDPLPLHKFLSGTVVSNENGCIIEPLADEPLAQLYKQIETSIGGKVGSKVTIEYVGYMVAGDIPKLPFCKSSYDYDPDFQYEKSVPVLLHTLTCGTYESDMLRYNSLPEQLEVDYGTESSPEHIGRIDTYEQFKTYEQAYEGLFGIHYGKEFFEANSLVFIYFQAGTGSLHYTYEDIYKKDGTLYIEIYANREGAHDTSIGEYSFSVALPKAELQDVENIEYIDR